MDAASLRTWFRMRHEDLGRPGNSRMPPAQLRLVMLWMTNRQCLNVYRDRIHLHRLCDRRATRDGTGAQVHGPAPSYHRPAPAYQRPAPDLRPHMTDRNQPITDWRWPITDLRPVITGGRVAR